MQEAIEFCIRNMHCCICSVIKNTQSKETMFEKFLFTSSKAEKPLWNILVPESMNYEFSVETNFHVKDNLIEAQWEKECMKDEIEKIVKDAEQYEDKIITILEQDQDNEGDEENKVEEDQSKDEDDDFELDDVNNHPCMLTILKVIDRLEELFSETWSKDEMPAWMEKLYSDYPNCNKYAKIFILKIMINRPLLFQPYAEHWFKHLAEYITSKDTSGKGFHYFLRDV